MCEHQTLYLNERIGYVTRCNECEKIQVAFANLLMTFTAEDFSAFRCWIKKVREEQPVGQNREIRCIRIPSPCQGIQLLLSRGELDDFSDMLESADSEWQSLKLIDLFHQ